MATLRQTLLILAGFILAPVVLWLTIAFNANVHDYLALVGAGLLLIGLAGVLWGLLWHRAWLAWTSVAILIVGILAFAAGPHFDDGAICYTPYWARDFWDRLCCGFGRPIGRGSAVQFGHLAIAGVIVANAILVAQRADWRRAVATNVLTGVAICLVSLMLSGHRW